MTENLILMMLVCLSVGFVTGGFVIYLFCLASQDMQNGKGGF